MPDGVPYVCYIDETGFYLGDAGLIASYIDLDTEAVRATWVPAGHAGVINLIRSDNVQTLWRSLAALAHRYRQQHAGTLMDQTVQLFMPCGATERYIAFDDLPWTSVPCPCGDPTHWMIRYTDEERLA